MALWNTAYEEASANFKSPQRAQHSSQHASTPHQEEESVNEHQFSARLGNKRTSTFSVSSDKPLQNQSVNERQFSARRSDARSSISGTEKPLPSESESERRFSGRLGNVRISVNGSETLAQSEPVNDTGKLSNVRHSIHYSEKPLQTVAVESDADKNVEAPTSPSTNRVLERIDRQVLISRSPPAPASWMDSAPIPNTIQGGLLAAHAAEREARWGSMPSSWAVKNSFQAWRACSTTNHTNENKHVVVIDDSDRMRELELLVAEKDRSLSCRESQLQDLRARLEAEQLQHSEILQAIGSMKSRENLVLGAISAMQAEGNKHHLETIEAQTEIIASVQALKQDVRNASRENHALRQNLDDLESMLRSVLREELNGLQTDLVNAGEDLAQKSRGEIYRKTQEMEQNLSSALMKIDADVQREFSVMCAGLGNLEKDSAKTVDTLRTLKEDMLSDTTLRTVLRQSLGELRRDLSDDGEALASNSRSEILRKWRETEQKSSSALERLIIASRDELSLSLSEQMTKSFSELVNLREDFRKIDHSLCCMKEDMLTENTVRSSLRELRGELQTQIGDVVENATNKSRIEIVRNSQEMERTILSAFGKVGEEVQTTSSATLSDVLSLRELSKEIEQALTRLKDEVIFKNRSICQSIAELAKADRNSEVLDAISRIRVQADLSPILAAMQSMSQKIDATPQAAMVNTMFNNLQGQLLQAINASSAGVAQTIAKIRMPELNLSPILAAINALGQRIDSNLVVAPVNAMVNNLQSQIIQAINVSSSRLYQAMANIKVEVKSPVACAPSVTEFVVPQKPQAALAPVLSAWRWTSNPSPVDVSRQVSSPRQASPEILRAVQPSVAQEIITPQSLGTSQTSVAKELIAPQALVTSEQDVLASTSIERTLSPQGSLGYSEQDVSRSISTGRRFSFTTGPRLRESEFTPRRLENSQLILGNMFSDAGTSVPTREPTPIRTVFMGQSSSRDTSPVKENFRPPRLMRAISAATSSLMPPPDAESPEPPTDGT